jgi:hypothetical protein
MTHWKREQSRATKGRLDDMKAKWTDDNYVTAYQLARDGHPDAQIAKIIGVLPETFREWKQKRPALVNSLARGRGEVDDPVTTPATVASFFEYVYNQLPEAEREVFEEILMLHETDSGIECVEAMLKNHGKRMRQHLFFHALVRNNFMIAQACSFVNISHRTFLNWKTRDPDFAELLETLHEYKKDFFEGALVKLVAKGDSAATIFANKTLNKDRGYGDKMTLDVQGAINHTHQHEHEHRLSIGELDLSIETRREILAAIKQANQQRERTITPLITKGRTA